jgi:hypothetical protein
VDEQRLLGADLLLQPPRAALRELAAGRELPARDRLGDVRLLPPDDLWAVERDVVAAGQ